MSVEKTKNLAGAVNLNKCTRNKTKVFYFDCKFFLVEIVIFFKLNFHPEDFFLSHQIFAHLAENLKSSSKI